VSRDEAIIAVMLRQVSSSTSEGEDQLTIDEQGAVTIPAPVRQAAGIKVGVPLAVYLEDGRVMIETREQLVDRIRREVAAVWTGEGSIVDDLIADRRTDAAGEARR
jgi:AbrB family looped-hinge helix DNA binding protein